LQFTDTHYGSNETLNHYSQIEMKNLINYENPNLVSLSGDIVSGYDWNGTSNWFRDMFNQALQPMIDSETYWAYTLGNHDDEGDWNRTQIIDYAITCNYSLCQKGPPDIGGVSNYVLTVFSSTNVPIANIWYMDSLDYNCYGVEGYNCVEFTTIQWYVQESQNLEQKYGRKLPGFLYIHIPLPEVLMLYNNFQTEGLLEDSGVCCWSLNTGLFSVLKERNEIVSVWHGHDHDNDFHGLYHNITLGYGRKTGFGGYGPPANMQRGARVIQFSCDPNNFQWQTWIRQDDGSIATQRRHFADEWIRWRKCCGSDGVIINRNLEAH